MLTSVVGGNKLKNGQAAGFTALRTYLGGIVSHRDVRSPSRFHCKAHDLPLHKNKQQYKHLSIKITRNEESFNKTETCLHSNPPHSGFGVKCCKSKGQRILGADLGQQRGITGSAP